MRTMRAPHFLSTWPLPARHSGDRKLAPARWGRRLLLAAGLLVACAGPVRADDPPKRIVSLNMCADQLLLALADPDQIAALSRYARDPRLNALAGDATHFPSAPPAAEAVLMLKPDLVLAGGFTPPATRDLLADQGIPLADVGSVETVPAAREQIRAIATRVGHPDRGEALVARIDAALADAHRRVTGDGRTALYLQRRGFVSGARTLIGDLLTRLGFQSAAQAFGVGSVGAVPLERLVATPPDILIVGARDRVAEDQGTALLAHPALSRVTRPETVVEFPEVLSICAGPVLPMAISALADGLAALPRSP